MGRSYSTFQDCEASLWVIVSSEKLSTEEAAKALCDKIAGEAASLYGYDCSVTLTEYEQPEDGCDMSATYDIECKGEIEVTVYEGAGTYDDYDEIDASDDPAGDMLYDLKKAFEGLGHRVLDADVDEDRSESAEKLYEQVRNSKYSYDRD